MRHGRVLDVGGRRFKPVEELDLKKDEPVHEGGDEMDIPDEDADVHNVREMDINNDIQDEELFYDTRMYLSDFSNLILNALIYKINKVLGFETLLMISKSGQNLYLLIRASDGDLSVHAQNQGYLLSLEVGYTDIETQPPYSLEPCDKYLNPLNKVIVPEKYEAKVDQYEKLMKEQLAHIYKKSKEGTRHSTNISIAELASELGTNDVFNGHGINDETWETYIRFLEIISKTLKNFIEDPTIEVTKDRLGRFLRKAYVSSISYANQTAETNKGKLKNLWGRLGIDEPMPAYTQYVRKINDFGEDEFDRFWTRYVTNEFNDRSIFSNSDKLKIMDMAIQSVFLISNMTHFGYLKAYFPLHDEYQLVGWKRDKVLKDDDIETDLCKAMGEDVYQYIKPEVESVMEKWNTSMKTILSPPVDKIRNYFGEKIAYYFDFISLWTKFMSLLILFGIPVTVTLWAQDPDDLASEIFVIAYAIMNVIVATLFVEFLKREEKYRASTWGTSKLADEDFIRPLFRGIFRRSPIDDDLGDPHFTFFMRYWRLMVSALIIWLVAGVSVGITVGLFAVRYELAKEWKGTGDIIWAPIITAIIGAILLFIKDLAVRPIIKWLTKFENLKTEAEYEFSYIMKFFVFRFINTFGPLFYIAFVKKYVTGCITTENNFEIEENNCMWELRYELIILTVFFFLTNFLEILIPYLRSARSLSSKITAKSIKGKSNEEILKTKVYIEYHRQSYDDGEINGVVEEYFEIVMQIGIVFIFSLAFGIIPLIAVIQNVMEIFIDRKKLVSLTRRPVQQSAKSHGLFTSLI